jgi:hypothetical protein
MSRSPNINRQIHALEATMGQAKVLAMRDRIVQINPDCHVTCIEEFVEPDNWPEMLPQGVSAVIDACDQVKAKIAMAAWAMRSDKPFISCGAAGGKRQAHLVDIADLASKYTHDPLLAQVRNRLRKEWRPARGETIGRELRLQPRGCDGPRRELRGRRRRLAQLSGLWIGGQRHRNLWSVRRRMGDEKCQAPSPEHG